MSLLIKEDSLIRTISPKDEMYHGGDKNYGEWYWYVGRTALESIETCLKAARKKPSEIRRILDLPCGHGRVLRYLKAAFPEAQLTACDLVRDGVDFCAATFDAVPVYSDVDPRSISIEKGTFDLIWVGSLLTHFNPTQWRLFLNFFASLLAPNGLLVFSAHGRYVYNQVKGLEEPINYGLPYWRNTLICHSYERTGFGYANYWRTEGYGLSLSNLSWVSSQIALTSELELVSFSERSWHHVHDIYGCMQMPDRIAKASTTSTVTFGKHALRQLTPEKFVQFGKTMLGRKRA